MASRTILSLAQEEEQLLPPSYHDVDQETKGLRLPIGAMADINNPVPPPDDTIVDDSFLESGLLSPLDRYPPFMYCIAIPYAIVWLFFAFLLSPPLILWFFQKFPSTLSPISFSIGGLITRILFWALETPIVFGLLFWNSYGLFWTMNILRLSPPFLQRHTEWAVVRKVAKAILSRIGDLLWAVRGRYESHAPTAPSLGSWISRDMASHA
ncbi:hypothetical protein DL93DRAFT_2155555, partial [Clavulina sp. PMI_390]